MSAAIVLGCAGAAALVLAIRRPAFGLGLILGLPLFFWIHDGRLDFGRSVVDALPGITLPLATFVAPVFVGQAWISARRLRASGRMTRVDAAVACFLAWSMVVFVWGYFQSPASSLGVFAQTVSPVFFYLVGRGWGDGGSMRQVMLGFAASATTAALLIAVSAPFVGLSGPRLSDETIGGLVIYQAWDYLPIMLAIATLGALSYTALAEGGRRFLPLALVLGAVTVGLYSRGALLALLLGAFAVSIGWRWPLRSKAVLPAVVAITLMLVFGAAGLGLTSASRLVDSLNPSTFTDDNSNTTRISAVDEAANVVADNPLVGDYMRAGRRDARSKGLGSVNAHNQYLDYGVRGGLPLAIAFVAIILLALGALITAVRQEGVTPEALALGSVLIGVGLASNMVQVNFVQPLTAYPLWLALGLAAAIGASDRPSPMGDGLLVSRRLQPQERSAPRDGQLVGREFRAGNRS